MNTEQLKELNLELLTERQKDAVLMAMEVKSQTEIGKLMGVTKQNVSALIKKAIERNSHSKTKECPKHHTGKGRSISPSPSPRRRNYDNYKIKDFSVLSPREREVISLKVEGLTHRQISDRLGISTGCIGVLLQRARGKLDGTYHDGLRLDINRKRREYVLKNPEKEKESRKKSYRKNREKRIEDMREYNKQYYQKHRIEILHKKKEMRFKSEGKS